MRLRAIACYKNRLRGGTAVEDIERHRTRSVRLEMRIEVALVRLWDDNEIEKLR